MTDFTKRYNSELLKSFIVPLPNPSQPFEIDEDSIVIRHQNQFGKYDDWLVGSSATKVDNNCSRLLGGDLASEQYQVLLKALVAKTLGAGEFSLGMGLSVPFDSWPDFRGETRETYTVLKQDFQEKFNELVSHIEFKLGSTYAEFQTCRVSPKGPTTVWFETLAVYRSIPTEYKAYGLWQLGYGDHHQLLVNGGKPTNKGIVTQKGIIGAVSLLSRAKNVSMSVAEELWISGKQLADGFSQQDEDLTELKYRCARDYISGALQSMITEIRSAGINNVIVSGGGAMDEIYMRALKDVLSNAKLDLHLIHQLNVKNGMNDDPRFSASRGLTTAVDLGIDVGNAFLKSSLDLSSELALQIKAAQATNQTQSQPDLAALVAEPVKPTAAPQVTAPVAQPAAAPQVTAPVAQPAAAPQVTAPVAQPTAAPQVTAPAAQPAAAPQVTAPTAQSARPQDPVAATAAVKPQVAAPVAKPQVATPAESAVKPQVNAPAAPAAAVKPQVNAPAAPAATVKPQVNAPAAPAAAVKPQVNAPAAPAAAVKPQVNVPAAPAAAVKPQVNAPAAPAAAVKPQVSAPAARTAAPVQPVKPNAPKA